VTVWLSALWVAKAVYCVCPFLSCVSCVLYSHCECDKLISIAQAVESTKEPPLITNSPICLFFFFVAALLCPLSLSLSRKLTLLFFYNCTPAVALIDGSNVGADGRFLSSRQSSASWSITPSSSTLSEAAAAGVGIIPTS
jgi:hypothetical protein